MNLLLLRPEECVSATRAVVRGARAAALVEEHQLKKDLSIRAGVRNGNLGHATVLSAAKDLLEIKLQLTEPPRQRDPIILAVGICRPQTVKKVIQAATTLGAAELHFVRTEAGEKSYLSSQALRVEAIDEEIDKALAQGVDTIPPVVTVQKKFLPFFEDTLPARLKELHWEDATRLVAATTEHADNVAVPMSGSRCYVAAIGSEAGWTEFEQGRLRQLGFSPVTLGPRMLRVETAVTALLAQIQLLRSRAVRGI